MTSSRESLDPRNAFDRFTSIVMAEPALFDQLRLATDATELARLAVALSRERGCEFGEADVRAALAAARQSWHERRRL